MTDSKKTTRRALGASVLSTLLSAVLLVGTTFAWFTSSVTTGANRIQAGSLKVDLLMDKSENGNYESIANGEGDIFSEKTGNGIRWEPGKTEIVYLAVRNLGNLALNYNIELDAVDGTPGLIGSLEYVILDGVQAADVKGNVDVTDWTTLKGMTAMSATGDIPAGKVIVVPNGTLDEVATATSAEPETDYLALAVHMKEEADNKYQDGSVTIDVNVMAKQAVAENDSFGPDYDKDATFDQETGGETDPTTPDQVGEVLANGGEIVFASDVEIASAGTQVEPSSNVTLDLNGHTLTLGDGIRTKEGVAFTVKNGTLNMGDQSLVLDGDVSFENATVKAYRLRHWPVNVDSSSNELTAELRIQNSTLELSGRSLNIGAGSKAVISGDSTIHHTGGGSSAIVVGMGQLTVEGNDAEVIADDGYAIHVTGGDQFSSLNVQGGTFIGKGGYGGLGVHVDDAAVIGSITIDGGLFTDGSDDTDNNYGYGLYFGGFSSWSMCAKVTINGGTFKGALGGAYLQDPITELYLNGGTFIGTGYEDPFDGSMGSYGLDASALTKLYNAPCYLDLSKVTIEGEGEKGAYLLGTKISIK